MNFLDSSSTIHHNYLNMRMRMLAGRKCLDEICTYVHPQVPFTCFGEASATPPCLACLYIGFGLSNLGNYSSQAAQECAE